MWHDCERNGRKSEKDVAWTVVFSIRISLLSAFETLETGLYSAVVAIRLLLSVSQFVWIKYEKKEEIRLKPLTIAPTPTEKKQHNTKAFDYTKIAARLRMVNLNNDSFLTGVVKPVYEIQSFHSPQQQCN